MQATVTRRIPIKLLKSEVCSLLGVSKAKQVKKLFPEYDLRRRDSWIAIKTEAIGQTIPSVFSVSHSANNIVSFQRIAKK